MKRFPGKKIDTNHLYTFPWPGGGHELTPHMGTLYKSQGWKGNKIPPNFEGKIYYCGVNFTVVASNSDGRDKVSKHRVFVQCLRCGRTIPAGRLGQHIRQSEDHYLPVGEEVNS